MTLLNAASSGPRNGCYGDVRQLADFGRVLAGCAEGHACGLPARWLRGASVLRTVHGLRPIRAPARRWCGQQ